MDATRIFEIVSQIETVAQCPVSLYVANEGYYCELKDELQLVQYCPKPYGFTTGDVKNYRQFVVAQAGQNHIRCSDVYKVVTSFRLYYFPGCCALCISSSASVNPDFQGRGLNKLGLQLRIELARAFNYSALVCTDIERNIPSMKTIRGAEFKELYSLRNKRTSNKVNLFLKEL